MAIETPCCGKPGRIRASGTLGLCDKCHGVALAIMESNTMRRQPLRAVSDGEGFRRVVAWLTSRQAT